MIETSTHAALVPFSGRMRLGDMLLEAGLISQEQLEEAIQEHKKIGVRLGRYLTQKGLLKEQQIVDLISRQHHLQVFHADKFTSDPKVAALIPAEIAQKYQVIPLSRRGRLLVVATVDPLDIYALDAVENLTKLEIEPVICTEREFYNLSLSIYGGERIDRPFPEIEELSVAEAEPEETEVDLKASSLQDMAEEAPVVKLVNSIFTQAVKENASDIHISPEKTNIQLRFRIDGKLREVQPPPKSYFLPIISRLKILSNMDISVYRVPQDGRFTVFVDNKEIHVRASTRPTNYGENVVLRLLQRTGQGLTLDELGMQERDRHILEQVIKKPYGMILSTGPTGSGKSTSLYAILRTINSPDVNIVTLEDPVEYRVKNIRQVQLNRKAGMTFAGGLRSILRQDPDVIMVGEIRDAETASIAVQSAMTGHKVLSTVHTNDSASAITRLLDMGIEAYLVSSVLLVSVAQRLVRRICEGCRTAYTPEKADLEALGLPLTRDVTYTHGKGCFQCNQTGYSGRTGIFEILRIDSTVQKMILTKNSAQEIARSAEERGDLRTLARDAAEKVRAGVTTAEEAASAVFI